MLRTRKRRLLRRGQAAMRQLQEIEASITNLVNDDLLDLADIFQAERHGPIGAIAFAEVARRKLSL